jgi:hypothetical protein
MSIKQTIVGFSTFFLLAGGISGLGCTESTSPAALQVMVQDNNGSLVHTSFIYIFSRNKKQFFGTRKVNGFTSFDLPAGDYRVYAALTLKADGYYDHYSSPETIVHVTDEEPASVVLVLQKAQNDEVILSDTARQKLGLSDELAKYIN